jgi:hypothetical protein
MKDVERMMRAAARVLKYRNQLPKSSLREYKQTRATFCGLCRAILKSPKALAASGDICLSCHMRGRKPRWLHLHGRFLIRARSEAELGYADFAALCGWSAQRQLAVEKQVKVQFRVARVLATTLVKLAHEGRSVRTAFREWPLFVVLADLDMVDPTEDEKEPRPVGDEERHGDLYA